MTPEQREEVVRILQNGDAPLFSQSTASLFRDVEQLRWNGATASSFASVAEKIGDARLATRVLDLERRTES